MLYAGWYRRWAAFNIQAAFPTRPVSGEPSRGGALSA